MKSILFIDNDLETLELLQDLYSLPTTVTVHTASDRSQAFNVLKKHNVDTIFIDVVLDDGETGYQLAKEISVMYPSIELKMMSSFGKEFLQNHYGGEFLVFSKMELVLTSC